LFIATSSSLTNHKRKGQGKMIVRRKIFQIFLRQARLADSYDVDFPLIFMLRQARRTD